MKAIHVTRVGGPEVMRLVDVPEPEPSAGEIRIRNRAIAVNFHDIQSRRHGEAGLTHPYVPGTDFAGVVDAVGPGVEGFAVGDRALGIQVAGAYAEKTVVPALIATRIPDDVRDEEAASCPVAGLTAYFLVKDNGARQGAAVVAHAAAGSVGCFLGGLLRDAGAFGIGLVSSPSKAEIARRAGFRHAIDYRREDVVARVRELTAGRGADLVLDSVAGPNTARSFDILRAGGTAVLFGRAGGDPPPAAILESFLGANRNLGLRTYYLGATIATEIGRIPGAYAELFDLFRRRAIDLPIDTLPLARAADAHARIESQQTVGKVVLVP
ncbi:MAG TPA: zinc-binding dehydrogenase [Candidatus Binatia bacterium]|nr:zinc-binding dehydrogenase [Candidatus Binatia bacterium]